MRRELRDGLLLGVAAALLAGLLTAAGGLQAIEAVTGRWRAAAFADGPQADEPIVLIAVDQGSLDWARDENGLSWPWPRAAYALVVDFCQRARVRSLSFDLLFTEPSLYGVDDDMQLAAALATLPVTVGSLTTGRVGATGALPIAPLADGFARFGDVGGRPDADSLFRRVSLLTRSDDRQIPSLPLAAFEVSRPQAEVTAVAGGLHIDGRFVPTDAEGRVLLNFRGAAGTFPTYTAAAVIQSELLLEAGESPTLDPQMLQGAHVFFGLTAPGLYDLRPTPLDGVFPGMEIHATTLDNLLTGDFLVPVPLLLQAAFVALLALLAGVGMRYCRTLTQTLLLFVVLLPLPLAVGFVAYGASLWLPVAPANAAVALALTGGVAVNFATEGRKKREIRRAFNQYLHPSVIEQLVSDPDKLRLGGEKRELSIFFSDLAGFSTISEQLEPEALTALLNAYLTAMTDIILDAGGTIDKYEGDAIIAFWNAPLAQADHARRAVQAAVACQQRLAELRPQFQERFGHTLTMRIGLNTGAAVVGNMGSTRRFDYTMLGDAVNLAARLEGVNKVFGTEVLFAEATREQLGNAFSVRPVATVRVVGRSEPVHLFAPLAVTLPEPKGFAAALESYRHGEFDAAQAAFAEYANDPIAVSYARRCEQLSRQKPAQWEGVWDLAEK